MNNLPEQFLIRMKALLGKDYPAFYSAVTEGEPTKALFVNTGKITPSDFAKVFGYPLEKLCFADSGFSFSAEKAGNLPLHHAGAFYIQDPSAMSTLCSVEIPKGAAVLDMCASPGGKTIKAAIETGSGGLVVSNEYNVSRCKTLVGNIERMGLSNVLTLCTDAADSAFLKDSFNSCFDLVIADCPCSGEGMFRKYPEEAIGCWSEENVKLCAERQRKILENAAGTVKDEGYLLYSTCTFSLDENEMVIDAFLSAHPDFSLARVKSEVEVRTAPAIRFEGCKTKNIEFARRFYPHLSAGEGQFIALMQRRTESKPKICIKSGAKTLSADEAAILKTFTDKELASFDLSKVKKYNDNIVFFNHDPLIPSNHVFSCGVKIGDVVKGRLVPHHQFFKAFGEQFKNKVHLTSGDERTARFLHGETFEYDIPNGFCAVFVDGMVLGGGKAVDGTIKNHYPKGLRLT